MTEWRLFEEGTVPVFTTKPFFEAHPWIEPVHQVGHAERIQMVVEHVHRLILSQPQLKTLVDLGCGDGSFLQRVHDLDLGVELRGYDAGRANVQIARDKGLDVTLADIVPMAAHITADIVTLTEVLEHLLDPHGLLTTLGGKWLVATVPLRESDEWHYEHHAWAWDKNGFHTLVQGAGWNIAWWDGVIAAGSVSFPPHGIWAHPEAQCIVAVRDEA